ncbi:MAG: molecular chaperone TorD family protein [Gammaproteobacteria bacterium]|nr:molecular chaperone TorD family protein [Gammaproteobacteria bacterium]
MLDALSLAVAYPSAALVDAWRSGDFLGVVEGAVSQMDPEGQLHPAYAELVAGLAGYLSATPRLEDIEADYVALFEFNRERPPVHLLQHLHDRQTQTTQLELYRQLAERYRSCGITLKQGAGTVPPDQLSVQLEFLAYLFRCLARVSAEDRAAETRRTVLIDTVRMLHWVDGPIECLAQSDRQHPLYLPLLRFVRHALDVCGTTVDDVD